MVEKNTIFVMLTLIVIFSFASYSVFTGSFVADKEEQRGEPIIQEKQAPAELNDEEQSAGDEQAIEEIVPNETLQPEPAGKQPSMFSSAEYYYNMFEEEGDEWASSGSWTGLLNINDSDYDTQGHAGGASPSIAYYYVNYTKPSNSYGANVSFKTGYNSGTSYSFVVPSPCWSYNANKLILRYTSSLFAPLNSVSVSCQNGTSFGTPIWQFVGSGGTDSNGHYLYEEAMLWNLSSNVTSCQNLPVGNTEYILTSDLTSGGSGNGCLTSFGSNIIINCNGHVINSTGATNGIYLDTLNNVTVKNCTILGHTSGIILNVTNNSIIRDSFINGTSGTGIQNLGNYNNITNITVTYGLRGMSTTSIGSRITNSTFNNNTNYGVFIVAGNNTYENNNFNYNGLYGIYMQSTGSNFTNNNASFNTVWDYYTMSSGNTITNITMNRTKSSFTCGGTLGIKSATTPAGGDPSGFKNISHYLNITNETAGAWIYLNVSYADSDISGVSESTMKIFKNSSSSWNQKLNFTGTLVSGVNTAGNYVYANISNFSSIFAPMGESPIDINSCQNITTANKVYNIINNLTGNQSNGICIDVLADNITLDCGNFNITGTYPGSTYGIDVNGYDNVTIMNCNIFNYSVGFRTANSENSKYSYLMFANNSQDMLALGFSENTTADNIIFNETATSFAYRGEFRLDSSNDPDNYDSYETPVDGFLNVSELPNFKTYYTFSSSHEVYDVERTGDGGYIMLMDYGYIVLLKLDAFGNQEWNKTYTFGDSRMGRAVKQTSDRGYVVAGQVDNSGDYDFLLFKVDRYGNKEWNRSYSNGLYDVGTSLGLTSDGGYVIAGAVAPAATYRPFVLKLDSNADEEWNFTKPSNGFAYAVMQTKDGGYAVCGEINDMFLTKLNSTGSSEWNYTRGDSGSNCDSFDQAVDDGYILTGQTSSSVGLMVKLNSTGGVNWTSTVNILSSTELYSVREISDGYFVAIGTGWTGARYVPIYARANMTGVITYWRFGTTSSYAAVCNYNTMEPSGGDIGVVFGCRGGTSGYPFLQKLNYEVSSSNQLNQWMFLNMSYDESKATESEDAISIQREYGGAWGTSNLFSTTYGVDTSNNIAYANITSFDTGSFPIHAPIEDANPCELTWTKTLTENLTCPSGLNIYPTGKLNTDGYSITSNGLNNINGELNATGATYMFMSDAPTYINATFGSDSWTGDAYFYSASVYPDGTYNATSGTTYISDYIELNGTYQYNGGIMQIGFGNMYPTNTKFTDADNIRLEKVDTPPPTNPGYSDIGYYVNITNLTTSGGFNGAFFNVTYNDLDAANEVLLTMWRYNDTEWTQTGFNDNGVNTTANYVYSVPLQFSIFAPMEQQTTISNCINLTTSNVIYTVNAPLAGVQTGWDRCIYINASNVTLDCDEYSITGSGTAGDDYSIYVENADNVTVEKCSVSGYNVTSVFINNSDDSNVFNSYFQDSGVAVISALNLNLRYNTIANIEDEGLYTLNMFESNISGNTIEYCSTSGTYLENSSNNTFENNIVNNNDVGLTVKNSNNNTFINNTFDDNTDTGIFITFIDYSSENNTFINNTASKNDVWDVYSSLSPNNTFINLTMNNVVTSFTYYGEIGILQTGAPTSDPTGYTSLGAYLNITNATNAWVFMNISYDELVTYNESKATMLRWNETDWSNVSGAAVDTTENYVYANISEFSIFATMEEQSPIMFADFNVDDTDHNINAEYSGYLTSAGTLINCLIEHNNSGTFSNTTPITLVGSSDWCNFTILNNDSNGANIVWYVWGYDSLGSWVRSSEQSFITTNTDPTLASVSSNVTNITEGTAVELTSSGASDYNQDNLGLECGYSNGASDACTGSYGAPERTCTLSWPFDDNEDHTLYCRVNDSYGVSTPDFELNITGYTPRFRISVQSPLNDSYHNTADLWFNITLNKNAGNCLMSIDENANITMDNSSSTTWYNYTTGLSESQHNVSFWCSRADGYENDSRLIYFAIDLTQPFINITEPVEGTTVNSDRPTVKAIVSETASTCTAMFDGSNNITMTNSSGNWNARRSLGNGAHNVIVYCSDRAGNWNLSDTVQFSVLVKTVTKGGGGMGTGLQPNITVNEIFEKQGFFVFLDYLLPNVHYKFPALWPDDLRITYMTLDNNVYDETFTARVVNSLPVTAPTGNVYQYFELNLDGLNSTPTKVDFAFRTRIDWLESTTAKIQNMKLYAHDGITWHELDTIVDHSNGTYVLFNSTDTALYKMYAIAEAGAEFKEISFMNVIYSIEKYYNGEIDFIDVLDMISEYYLQSK